MAKKSSSKGKPKCPKGMRYSKKYKECKTPCKSPMRRSSKYPFGCYTPKKGKKTGSKPKCAKSKTGRTRVYITTAKKCMSPCRNGKRRSSKKPYKCYTPKKR